MPLFHIIEHVTERRVYLIEAKDEDSAKDSIDNAFVLPSAVRVLNQDYISCREVTKAEMEDA